MDEALEQLKLEDPGKAKIVMLKFFAGLTNKQVAEILQARILSESDEGSKVLP